MRRVVTGEADGGAAARPAARGRTRPPTLRRRPAARAGIWWLPFVLLSLDACAPPVNFARPADILQPGELRVRAGDFLGAADKSGTVERTVGSGPTTELVEGRDSSVAWHVFGRQQNAGDALLNVFGLPFTWELAPSYGLFPGCEVGVFGILVRAGLELRCGIPRGAPIALAVSGAVMLENPGADGGHVQYRAGLDLSFPTLAVSPVVNVYLGYGEVWRTLYVEAGRGAHFPDFQGIERDELRLSVPVGVSFPVRGRRGDVTVAITPEYTLDAGPLRGDEVVVAFEQRWAVYLVVTGSIRLVP